MGPKGEAPYWHQVEDTYDKMDPEVMARAYEFTWQYITAIDSMVRQKGAVEAGSHDAITRNALR